MRINRLVKDCLKVVAGFVILFVLLSQVGFSKIMDALTLADPNFLLFIILGMITLNVLYPCTLLLLYYPLRVPEVPLMKFFRLRLWTQMMGNLTPSKVGELFLFFFLKRKFKIKVVSIFWIFLMDKVTSLLVALVFAAVGFRMIVNDVSTSRVLLSLVIVMLSGFVVMTYSLRRLTTWSEKLVKRKSWQEFLSNALLFFQEFFRNHRIFMVYNVLATLCVSFATAVVAKLVFLSLQVQIPFFNVFLVTSMIAVASLIPFNVLGVGAKEISSVYFFSLLGISTAVTTAAVILVTLAKYVSYGILFLLVRRVE